MDASVRSEVDRLLVAARALAHALQGPSNQGMTCRTVLTELGAVERALRLGPREALQTSFCLSHYAVPDLAGAAGKAGELRQALILLCSALYVLADEPDDVWDDPKFCGK